MRALLLSAALLLSGCYKIDYVRGAPSAPVPTTSSWHHIGILGLVEFSDPVPLNTICPTGFARVHHEVSVLNTVVTWVLGSITGGVVSALYQPSTISVYCNSGQAYDVEVNDSGMALSVLRTE